MKKETKHQSSPTGKWEFRFSARLSKEQLDCVKGKQNPSKYIRDLIDNDMKG